MPITAHDLFAAAESLHTTVRAVKKARHHLDAVSRLLADPLAISAQLNEEERAIFLELVQLYRERIMNTTVCLTSCDEWLTADQARVLRAAHLLRVCEQANPGNASTALPPQE